MIVKYLFCNLTKFPPQRLREKASEPVKRFGANMDEVNWQIGSSASVVHPCGNWTLLTLLANLTDQANPEASVPASKNIVLASAGEGAGGERGRGGRGGGKGAPFPQWRCHMCGQGGIDIEEG